MSRRRLRPSSCCFLIEYQRERTRVTCQTHNLASRWLPNLEAINWRNKHEQTLNREES